MKSLVLQIKQYFDGGCDSIVNKLSKNFNFYDFHQDVQSNGLNKLSDDRIVLFTTVDHEYIPFGSMNMYLIDFYNEYEGMKIREYKLYFPRKKIF